MPPRQFEASFQVKSSSCLGSCAKSRNRDRLTLNGCHGLHICIMPTKLSWRLRMRPSSTFPSSTLSALLISEKIPRNRRNFPEARGDRLCEAFIGSRPLVPPRNFTRGAQGIPARHSRPPGDARHPAQPPFKITKNRAKFTEAHVVRVCVEL